MFLYAGIRNELTLTINNRDLKIDPLLKVLTCFGRNSSLNVIMVLTFHCSVKNASVERRLKVI